MKAGNKVVLNTGILYARMIFTVGISLYTTRLVLNGLGSTDYGIFNVVAGIVFILSFLNTAMATSTQRYLSYYESKADIKIRRKVFFNSFMLHLALASVIALILELSAGFLFDTFLKIPQERLEAAVLVYHYVVFSIAMTVVAVPFSASLIAHENMFWVALVNIIEALLKLVTGLLLYTVVMDRLVFFGIGTALTAAIVLLLYMLFCFLRYDECNFIKFRSKVDLKFIKELGSNASWNLFGVLAGMGKNQGMIILLNYFFGPKVNASFSIANQVSGQLNFFAGTMLRAINPQIMKSEGQGDRERMIKLSLLACKYCFCLLAIIAIPAAFEIDFILKMWLKAVPAYTAEFCVFVLIGFMLNQVTIGLDSAVQAVGNIKNYMIFVGITKILMIPVGFVMLYFKFSMNNLFILYILLEALGSCIRLYCANVLMQMSGSRFYKDVLIPIFLPVGSTILVCLGMTKLYDFDYRFLVTFFVGGFTFFIVLFFVGMKDFERSFVYSFLDKFRQKIKINVGKNIDF